MLLPRNEREIRHTIWRIVVAEWWLNGGGVVAEWWWLSKVVVAGGLGGERRERFREREIRERERCYLRKGRRMV